MSITRDSNGVILDGTFVKAHQDACRYKQTPDEQKLGKTKGGRNSKLSVAVSLEGKALRIRLVSGNCNDITCAKETLPDNIKGQYVIGDKAYDGGHFRQLIAEREGIAVIPPRENRREPAEYDKTIGKLRHRVEMFFSRIKRYRRVATRFDRRADTFLGFVYLAAIADCVLR